MSTAYTSPDNQWPLLQSSIETKHKSGLLSVSGQFISPSDVVDLPNFLPSTVGDITNLYPSPTISRQGVWNTYNATGYGTWGSSGQTIKTLVMVEIACIAVSEFYGSSKVLTKFIRAAGEAATVQKAFGDTASIVLPGPPTLSLIGKQKWSASEVFFSLSPSLYTGNFSEMTPNLDVRVQSVRSTQFGMVTEVEVTYELTARLEFGYFVTADVPEIL